MKINPSCFDCRYLFITCDSDYDERERCPFYKYIIMKGGIGNIWENPDLKKK